MFRFKKILILGMILLLQCALSACRKDDTAKGTTVETTLETTAVSTMETTAETAKETVLELHAPSIEVVNYDEYFNGIDGSAVFYTPSENRYEIYNEKDAYERRSPCSTFKIISSLTALENGIITADHSARTWSGEIFWNENWNRDMEIREAFKTSCIWYFRKLTDELGENKMQTALDELGYGNCDITDWIGSTNLNNENRALTGFWVESSLLISPKEQTEVLYRIFGSDSSYNPDNVALLKEIMTTTQNVTPVVIHGKTGYGKLGSVSLDSWFVGMFEKDSQPTYFAIHLGATDNPEVSSALAKEIAIQIIADKTGSAALD